MGSIFDSVIFFPNFTAFGSVLRPKQMISNSLTRQKKTLHVHHTCLYISLASTARLPVKLPNQSCFVKDVNKQ